MVDIEKIKVQNPGITEIVVPEGITEIGEGAFCQIGTSLEKVVLPSTLKKIGDEAFRYCEKLVSVNLPESLETIGKHAFSGTQLSEVYLGDNIKQEDQFSVFDAFAGCQNLKKVRIPKGVSSFSFNNCNNLCEVELPEGIERIPDSAFSMCAFTKIRISGTVKEIGKHAFSCCENLEEVELPEGLETIEYSAFEKTKIKNVKLPSTLRRISGFNDTPMESVELPEGLREIGYKAFCGSNLKQVKIPESTETIGSWAFAKTRIEKIEVPENVYDMEISVFESCSDLKEVRLKKIEYRQRTIKSFIGTEVAQETGGMGDNFFNGCGKLEKVVLPEGLKKISRGMFLGCESLKEIVIPQSVGEIGSDAFKECRSLKKIILPKNLVCISADVFRDCESLEEIEIPECSFVTGKHIQHSPFLGCKSLRKITVHAEEIPHYFVAELKNLETVELLGDTKSLGEAAFKGCGVKKIRIAKTLETIGEAAFEECDALSEFELEEENETFACKSGCLFAKKNKRLVRAVPAVTTDGKKKFIVPKEVKEFGVRSFPNYVKDCEVEIEGTIKKTNDRAVDGFFGKQKSYFDPKPNIDTATGGALTVYNADKREVAKKEKITELKAAGTEGLIDAAFDGWEWGFAKTTASTPSRTVLVVNLPLEAKFVINLAPKPTQKEANFVMEKMTEIKAAVSDGSDSYVGLFAKIRELAENCTEEVKSGNNRVKKICFARNYGDRHLCSAGFIDEAYIKNDLKRLLKGSGIEFQIKCHEVKSRDGNKPHLNVDVCLKKGDKILLRNMRWYTTETDSTLLEYIEAMKSSEGTDLVAKIRDADSWNRDNVIELDRL